MQASMLRPSAPPSVWLRLVYVLLTVAISWQLDWPKMLGFPLRLLGVAPRNRSLDSAGLGGRGVSPRGH